MPINIFTTIDESSATSPLGPKASGINNAGTIVGTYRRDHNDHGFERFSSGLTGFINAPSAFNTEVSGINDQFRFVGSYEDASGFHGFLHGDVGFTTIDVSGASSTSALGINNAGTIVGAFGGADLRFHGFVRSSSGLTAIINAPSATLTEVFGINDQFQFVGFYQDASGQHGFLGG